MKGTPSQGRKRANRTHGVCRRCGRKTFHRTKKKCSSCGFGKTTKIRTYSWQNKV